MRRRNFLTTVIPAGIATTLLPKALTAFVPAFDDQGNTVIIKNGSSAERFINGIGMRGGLTGLIRKGDKVVIKPAMAYDSEPGKGLTTNPQLVRELINRSYAAGAHQVSVFDHTWDSWTKCYKDSGIERIAKDARARVWPANDERYYSEVKSAKSEFLKSVKIHNALLDADVFINVSVIEMNNEGVRASIFNLTGCIWDRDFITDGNYDTGLADLLYYLHPDLTVIDADTFSPQNDNDRKINFNKQIISDNPVFADSVVCRLLNISPDEVGYLKIAEHLGFGTTTVALSEIRQLNLKS